MAGSSTAAAPQRTQADLIERITWQDKVLAVVIRSEFSPAKTTFLTPNDYKQQVGFVVYPAGGVIQRHVHKPLERHLVGTSEVLLVKRGRCEVDIYHDDRQQVATVELRDGDLMLMVGGGHGFRMIEDTVFMEVKQGPYTGVDEKERF